MALSDRSSDIQEGSCAKKVIKVPMYSQEALDERSRQLDSELMSEFQFIQACSMGNERVVRDSSHSYDILECKPLIEAVKRGRSNVVNVLINKERIKWNMELISTCLNIVVDMDNMFLFKILMRDIGRSMDGFMLKDNGCGWLSHAALHGKLSTVVTLLKTVEYTTSELFEVANTCPHVEIKKMICEWE